MKRLFMGLLLLSAGSTMAVDGVIEINQLCVATGCFAGDAPGFPVTLPNNGSYRLTSNLTITNVNESGIVANADLVTVDLNGFTIRGPVGCSGSPVTSCNAASGTGIGVELNASGNSSNSTVKNGLIQGMGSTGVDCVNCRIINVSARANRVYGFFSVLGTITNSSAISNGLDGILTGGIVEGSFAQDNRNDGFSMSFGGLVRGSQAFNNGSDGILCFNCLALDNVTAFNTDFGIRFGNTSTSRASYGRNNIYSNDGGTVFGNALQLDNNRCDATLC